MPQIRSQDATFSSRSASTLCAITWTSTAPQSISSAWRRTRLKLTTKTALSRYCRARRSAILRPAQTIISSQLMSQIPTSRVGCAPLAHHLHLHASPMIRAIAPQRQVSGWRLPAVLSDDAPVRDESAARLVHVSVRTVRSQIGQRELSYGEQLRL